MRDEEINALRREIATLQAQNLNLQDRMNEFVGPITDEERMELIRLRVGYTDLLHAYSQACRQIEELTGSDPRLPKRDGD